MVVIALLLIKIASYYQRPSKINLLVCLVSSNGLSTAQVGVDTRIKLVQQV